jgi:RNA polymerase sigma-70 factor (sigma-E family)
VTADVPEAPTTFEEYAACRLPALLRFAAALTGSHDLAQDVVQEVLIRVHARWRQISRLDVPDQYIRRMITNEFLSWRRRWGRLIPVGQLAEDHRPAGVAELPHAETLHAERDALLVELGRLPRRQQAVLVLRYYEGLSDAEIADLLGCRPGTVRGYASRALSALRVELDPADRGARQRLLVKEDR